MRPGIQRENRPCSINNQTGKVLRQRSVVDISEHAVRDKARGVEVMVVVMVGRPVYA